MSHKREAKELRFASARAQVRAHILFASLTDEQFDRLMKCARLIDLDSDQTLFVQGDEAERFYVVLDGSVKLFRLTSEGREIVMNVMNRDRSVGEAAMFMAKHHYPVNASAIERSSVLGINSAVYQGLLRESSESCFGVLGAMACRLQNSMAEIETLTMKSATHRVIRFLLTLVSQEAGEVEIKLPVAKQLIAARLAMQPETFSRVMRELKNRGVLQVRGGHLKITSIQALKEMI